MERYIIKCVGKNGYYFVVVRACSYAELYRCMQEIRFRDETVVYLEAWHDFGDDTDD